MSQAVPNAPSVIVNAASNRQQVPLRDYLNARVAPFLKKAITESLDAEYVLFLKLVSNAPRLPARLFPWALWLTFRFK